MAKVKSSGLRNYVGRLGGSVYYMLKGQNIAREKAPEVSNPRTATQMRQRMQWGNIVGMYKCLQPYLAKKSFQNKPATWSDYNAFMSANLGSTPVYLTKDMVQNGHSLLAPYKVTEGSLPSIGLAFNAGGIGFLSDIDATSLTLGEDETIGALSEVIINDNTGWQEGDQLGFIIMMNGRTYRPYVYAFELILDKSDTRLVTEVFDIDDYPFFKSENKLGFTYEKLYNPTQGLAVACALIHSRTVSGKTSVSTQSLVLNADAMTEYNKATTEEAFNNARESYGIPTEVWLDAGYQGESGGTPSALTLKNIVAVWYNDKISEQGGNTSRFNIQPGGRNGLGVAGADTTDSTTKATCYLNQPLVEGDEYCLVFLPQGDEENFVNSQTVEAPTGKSITFEYARAGAQQITYKAGRYVICHSDAYEPDKIVVEMNVTA